MVESDTTPSSSLHSSRPTSPNSQMANSLYRATATIDELTTTLAKISRAPTDNANLLPCCCGRDLCEHRKAWVAFHGKLESRLIICAEVGQALLEKHDAYVRRHASDISDDEDENVYSRPETPTVRSPLQDSQQETRVAELLKENLVLEKKLNTALLNAEVAESSKKSVMQELDEAKETVSRLTVNQVKSTGWELRLNATAQEKDDLRQELHSERQRSKGAEAHVLALKDRCAKQQSEMSRLHDELEQRKQSRTELSEEILRDARARLQMVQQQQFGHTVVSDSPEVTQVMESLVADNEAFKRDIAELQNLLVEAREDVRMLREEVDEAGVTPGADRKVSVTSVRRGHNHTFSWASSFGQAPFSPPIRSAASSTHPYEPLTPSTEARPLSPAESRAPSEKRFSPLASPRPKYPSSHVSIDIEEGSLRTNTPETSEKKSPRRPLFLLTHNRGVQTDDINWSNLLGLTSRAQTDDGSSETPPGGHSESSSLADSHAHALTIAALVDRANGLFTRMAQADARTLLNRLKRQRLAGDISHLSHATVSAILNEVSSLRGHFRGVLEDERTVSTCTRRDLRALLALLREMFAELGQMRIALNDIILDPSSASHVSEVAMDPTKASDEARRASGRGATAAGGWLFSKLFGGTPPSEGKPTDSIPGPLRATTGPSVSAASATMRQKPPKIVPKLGPALAASTTTVNVEFSGAGVGRSVSNALTTVADAEGEAARSTTPVPNAALSRGVMGIFAGAPQMQDPWVILPKSQQKPRASASNVNLRTAALTRSAGRWAGNRLSRNVDAVIDSDSAIHDSDDEEDDSNLPSSLLERTLRPRGLSDSSIRSSFLNDENDEDNTDTPSGNASHPTVSSPTLRPRSSLASGSFLRPGAFPGYSSARPSVLKAFSRAFTTPVLSAPAPDVSISASLSESPRMSDTETARAVSPRRMPLLPSLAQWAVGQAGSDEEAAEDYDGSVRGREEEPTFNHLSWQRGFQGMDI
ncbi:hypothetical protein DFH11DRAFT_699408 [Phellopilus nigrolimitatus]|nr:hypothetical protein DFH11DRAFT_699408 [Phellopilus nigrolimitatus]